MNSPTRAWLKRLLYGSCPGFAGSFPYYGVRTYFPRHSVVFCLACEQGIYEAANVRVLLSALHSNATVFDVGANIGLMSIPLLAADSTVRVISIEASPKNHEHLARTVGESRFGARWETVACAAGDSIGEAEFHCATPALGAFDSLANTGRAGAMAKVRVPLTTLDRLWQERGRPSVCALKIDVEGAELSVLRGAIECIRTTRPMILVEWNETNLRSFDVAPDALLSFAAEHAFAVYAMPTLVRVHSRDHLRALMMFDESFVLMPNA